MDCVPAVSLDGRGVSKAPVWHDMVYKTMKERLEDMDWRRPPYSTRYPELAALAPFFENGGGVPPGNIVVARNICVGGKWTEIGWGATEEMVRFEENLLDTDPRFANAAEGDFAMPPDSPAFKMGFKPIPFERIGLPKKR